MNNEINIVKIIIFLIISCCAFFHGFHEGRKTRIKEIQDSENNSKN